MEGIGGALLTLRLIKLDEHFHHSSPITKSKLLSKNNFNYFGKFLKKTPPNEHPSPSLEPSTPKVTRCHCIYARYISLSSIHSVCIMLFILFPLIRWSYIHLCCAPFLLTTTWHHWMTLHQHCFSHHNQPWFNQQNRSLFQNYQSFFNTTKWKVENPRWWLIFLNTLSDIFPAPAPYIANTIRFANTQIFSQF